MAPSSERHQRPVLEERRSIRSHRCCRPPLPGPGFGGRFVMATGRWSIAKFVYFVPVAASLAIIGVTRVIDDEIRGPVNITSAYCLNTVPGNCLDCVAELQTGSGERRGKHQPNCNAFDLLGGHESNRHTRHCLRCFAWLDPSHKPQEAFAAVCSSVMPLRRRDPVSLRVCEVPRIRQCFPKNQGRRTCQPVEPGPTSERTSESHTSSRPPLRQFTRPPPPASHQCNSMLPRTGPGNKQSKTPLKALASTQRDCP